jgi:muramoyltetrapeptide carboxypeptidase
VTEDNFIRPARLRAGARVALVAPAGPVTEERIAASMARCQSLGLDPVVGPNAHLRTAYLAGSDVERARDVMWAFTDPDIDAVWALRGGYGTMRLHAHLDFDVIAATRKPYLGFSDNTYMHLMLAARRVVSFHAPHAGADFPPETEAAFLRVLFGDDPPGALPLRADDVAPATLRGGFAQGRLVGGNLSLLAASCGTPAQLAARDCIVFVEEVGEPAYRIDRCFTQLAMAGALTGVRGFAFGRFSEIPESSTEEEVTAVLRDLAESYGVPAAVNFPFGHVEHNWTLPVGGHASLDADACVLQLIEPAVH